jgi:hypothetical protein
VPAFDAHCALLTLDCICFHLLPAVAVVHLLLLVPPTQLEMEYIFSGLEEEALDVSGDELRNNFKGACVRRQHSKAQHSMTHVTGLHLSDCLSSCVNNTCLLT